MHRKYIQGGKFVEKWLLPFDLKYSLAFDAVKLCELRRIFKLWKLWDMIINISKKRGKRCIRAFEK
jgi:hypothetical protein